MSTFNHILESAESTVVSEYIPEKRTAKTYQSEAELENEFIANLVAQGYEYLPIHEENDLKKNLRKQLELLNSYEFSDSEWERFFRDHVANTNDGIVEKTRKIQTDHVQAFRQDNGATKNIYLFDKKHIHNNRLQVINQYEESAGTHKTRYDVTILVNGLPLVHIELKRRGVSIKEAFNQIDRYQRDSFWAASGLYEYVQIFVITNGTETKYYSNTTRNNYIKELSGEGKKRSKKTSNSFEFTSYWADSNNKVIPDLVDFTKTFFAKHALLNILAKYCILDVDNKLLVMRPYQIVATERILNRIEIATNYKRLGSVDAGGYIWHTTGSGKTLTSFKTAQLASRLPDVEKVLFVVDRKDLDYQTMKEYDRFEKGAANGNNSTRELERQLSDTHSKIIVTTIQKLNVFVRRNKQHDVYRRHIVLILDECHRSQFGEMHTVITKTFKNYNLFGFTGTPIFAQNAGSHGNPFFRTTEQAFGDKLHTYTIVDAINDGNVLPFRVDYLNTIHDKANIEDEEIAAIDREKAMNAPERIAEVTKYILEHFDQKTKRNSFYRHADGRRLAGFNSILAVSSIPMAKLYYEEFRRQLAQGGRKLTVATIFSFAQNEDLDDMVEDEDLTAETLDQSSRDFLEGAIRDYNHTFNTDFDTSSDKFQNYYKDLSMRVKSREVDLLIVVNMFLTGFDATTLNTLWVDKDLRMHGLIQAFSRTNRILNAVKRFGNIVCFRNLQEKVDEAIGLFGDREASGVVLLRSYGDYLHGYEKDGVHQAGYDELIAELRADFPPQEIIVGEQRQDDFIRLFGKILRMRNILTSFDQFAGDDILAERELQDYQGIYLGLYEKKRTNHTAEKENINDDLVFEIELVRQTEVNVDYILALVVKFHESNCENREILVTIDRAIDSSLELRSKKQLIHDFINTVTHFGEIHDDWQKFVNAERVSELNQIIEQYHLKTDGTYRLVENAFRDGVFKTTGVEIDRILPPMSRFDTERKGKKETVIQKLRLFFDKFFGAI